MAANRRCLAALMALAGLSACGSSTTEVAPGNSQGGTSDGTEGDSDPASSSGPTSATVGSATSTSGTTGNGSSSSAGSDTSAGSDVTSTAGGSTGDGGVSAGSSSSDGTTTGAATDAYGACPGGQSDCLFGEICIGLSGTTLCAPECGTVADCPAPPPGGNATLECRNPGVGSFVCMLDCQAATCPTGMMCNQADDCSW